MTQQNGTIPQSGIYQILCIPTSKVYIGSAMKLHIRQQQHLRDLRGRRHRNSYLQHAFDKYGEDAFLFTVLELVSIPNLLEREQHWMDTKQAVNPRYGFNIAPTAGSPLGTKASPAVRARLSAARRGKPKSAEHRAKIGAAHKGKVITADHRARMSATIKAKNAANPKPEKPKPEPKKHTISPELRAKLNAGNAARIARLREGQPQKVTHPGTGKGGRGVPKSPEHRAKIQAAVKAAKQRGRAS